MHLFNRSPKKAEISLLLDVNDPVNTAKLESSAVARAACVSMPKSLSNLLLYSLLAIGASIASLMLAVGGAASQNTPLILIGAAGAFIFVIVFIALLMNAAEDKKLIYQYLQEAREELRTLHSHLASYIETVDKRTNRFFHCVTTSKVTTYYILNQIDDELEKALVQLREIEEANSPTSLEKGLALLKGTLTVTDGLIAESGRPHQIAFHNIKAVLGELEEKMESGIKEIEAEIYSFRNSGPKTSSPEEDISLE